MRGSFVYFAVLRCSDTFLHPLSRSSPSLPPSAPYFSHPLPVSFPLRNYLFGNACYACYIVVCRGIKPITTSKLEGFRNFRHLVTARLIRKVLTWKVQFEPLWPPLEGLRRNRLRAPPFRLHPNPKGGWVVRALPSFRPILDYIACSRVSVQQWLTIIQA